MGQVIDPRDWRRHPAGAAKTTGSSLSWRASRVYWAEPMLLGSLIVWRAGDSERGRLPAGGATRIRLRAGRQLAVGEPAMKRVWIVRWRGLEETCTSLPEALDRRDQLDAHGVAPELFEVAGGQRRKVG